MHLRQVKILSFLVAALGLWGIGGVSDALSAGEGRSKTDHGLLDQWELVSVKASTDKDRLFSRVEGLAFTKEAAFGATTVPSRVVIELTDGRILSLDYTLFLSKKPQAIDLVLETRGPAETFQGIFKVDGDTLQLCISGSREDRPAAFSVKEGANQVLLVLRRKKNKTKAAHGPD